MENNHGINKHEVNRNQIRPLCSLKQNRFECWKNKYIMDLQTADSFFPVFHSILIKHIFLT